MAKTRQQKQSDLDELISKLKSSKSVVFSQYRGTTVKDIDKLRNTLRAEGVNAKVYKVTLINKALQDNQIQGNLDYKEPVIAAFSEDDEVAPARLVKSVGKEVKTVGLLSGVVDGKFASKEQVLALADLPSKLELRAKLVGTMNAPVSGFVNVLAGNLRGLINVLNAMAAK